ncbi:DegT/DnrJ/EryC1/StrS family aminotransferase [Bradyrhizobium sp. INPA01-394B]|uniref:DegT/DnrJ/EryC1/StrS family aminotransferase n=1 Tax=Bradyrhizobium campsiandrae TaxID=1729892 RepID=A0ABR7UJT3_9BRAD|nr:DegT/DnrJ/EryC1/StrS family aminotransferase [Bradyrhizobium campsiandrae]MBC9875795.1 DegT/DnrJ/EryC1/StrS family aminotransferase [Bradyrhizobium campsiandrae]MBC9984369.1 DegT/DnrJ/EryC1/StrS family aminotransferase [Bradyrhizobium campsiandrae]
MSDAVPCEVLTPRAESPLHIVRPRFPRTEQFLAAFERALETGQVTNNSRWVVEFEARLSEYLGVPTLVFCNGQIGMMAMLRAAGIAGGEVIVPSFTFSATPHAIRWVGAEPVFADIVDDMTMRLDPDDVERRITDRTVAILAVDVYGVASDYASLARIARRNKLKFLVDSAPSFGTRVDGRLVGGCADAQMFSFHATKAFATMEGGCVCSHDPELLARVKAMRNFGQVDGADCHEAGLNGKMLEISALIGLEQLKTFELAVATRRRAVERMRIGLSRIPGLRVGREPAGVQANWLYLPVVVDADDFGLDREALASALETHNVFVRKYYSPPCHHMTAYSAQREVKLDVTERVAYNVIALPVYNDMTDEECDRIVAAIQRVRQSVQDHKHIEA